MKKISTLTIVLFLVLSVSFLLTSLSLAEVDLEANLPVIEQTEQIEQTAKETTQASEETETTERTTIPKRTSTWGIIGLIVLFGIIMAMPSGKKKESKESRGPEGPGKPKY